MANPQDIKPVLHTKKHIARLERERVQTRAILYGFIAILVIVIGLVVYGYLDVSYFQARRPIANVGNVGIKMAPWQARVRLERTRLVNQLTLYQQYSQYLGMDLSSQEQQVVSQLNAPITLGQTVLNQMIDEEVVRQEAAKRGITASEQEVQNAIQANYDFYPNGTPTVAPSPTTASTPTFSPETLALVTLTPTPGAVTPTATATLAAAATANPLESPVATGAAGSTDAPTLAPTIAPSPTSAFTSTPAPTSTAFPTATPVTKESFETSYKAGTDRLVALGLTQDQIHEMYATDILRQKLFDIVTADVPRSEEKVWARHILVTDEATANAVRQRLVNGEDFAKVAAEVSTDTGSKVKGGDLGWFGKGAMVAEFENAAFGLKVGEISQPIKSQFGYHIIQVLAHSNIPLDANAYQQAQQTAFTDWLSKLRDGYKVKIFNNWENNVPTDPATPLLSQ
jgi:parvulin-like peptidyl-prolyl isomerase